MDSGAVWYTTFRTDERELSRLCRDYLPFGSDAEWTVDDHTNSREGGDRIAAPKFSQEGSDRYQTIRGEPTRPTAWHRVE